MSHLDSRNLPKNFLSFLLLPTSNLSKNYWMGNFCCTCHLETIPLERLSYYFTYQKTKH